MGNRRRADEEDVAFGGAPYCATAPSRGNCGRKEADLAASERPWWAPGRDMGSRADATATEKASARSIPKTERTGREVERIRGRFPVAQERYLVRIIKKRRD